MTMEAPQTLSPQPPPSITSSHLTNWWSPGLLTMALSLKESALGRLHVVCHYRKKSTVWNSARRLGSAGIGRYWCSCRLSQSRGNRGSQWDTYQGYLQLLQQQAHIKRYLVLNLFKLKLNKVSKAFKECKNSSILTPLPHLEKKTCFRYTSW
jgi:hypothetical protein